jgi:hypothetical protein
MNICIPATITGIKTMRDNTWRLQVDTQEISPEDMTEIALARDKLGYFFFHDTPIKEIDLSKIPPIEAKGNVTKSQVLRYTLYHAWEQTDRKKDFDTFYGEHMDKITEYVATKYLTNI